MKKSKLSIHRLLGLGELTNQGARVILSFWLIILMTFFLFGDQNLISPNLKNIAHSFGIMNEKDIDWYMGGLIPILFFILGGLVSVSIGYFSGTFKRKYLLLFSVLMGEIPCFLTAYSQSYIEFLIFRTLCGFGLGGIFPIIFSIIGDYFSSKSRANATAFISLAMGLGIGIGQLVGGILGEKDPINGWRTSFILMSAPSFLFAGIYALFCKEPTRGASEEELISILHKRNELSFRFSFQDFKILFSNKTNLGIFLQGIPGCVPWGVFFVFLADYYEYTYGIGKVNAAGLITFAAIGVFLGTFLGGMIGQWLYNINKIYQPILCMISVFLGIFPCLYLLFAPREIVAQPTFIFINILTGITISITSANVRAILINVNTPKNRGSIFSLYNLTDDLGKGLGPAISAILLGLIADRSHALAISVLFWVPCSLAWWIVIKNIKNDENNVHLQLKEEVLGYENNL